VTVPLRRLIYINPVLANLGSLPPRHYAQGRPAFAVSRELKLFLICVIHVYRVLPNLLWGPLEGGDVRFGPLLIVVLCAAMPLTPAASEVVCVDSQIVVVAQTDVDHESICLAARKALTFLVSIGLEMRGRVTIKLVDRFMGDASDHAIGQYDSRRHEISLLSYDAALKASREQPAFHLPMSRDLWHSYVSHELAHAAALQHFAPGVPTFTSSEYIAAVAQLATLSPTTREGIFQNYRDVEAFDNENEISHLYYLMNPCMFAVKAYLHYLKPENGPRFINRLIQRGVPN